MSSYYVGLDVHQASICIAVLNAAGKLVMESVVETSAATVLDSLKGLRGRVEVTFEEGTHAAWLYDVLHKTKAGVIVCDPRKNRLLQDGNKSDRVVARKLAQLLRAGLLSPVYHGERGTRDLKELARSYEYLVEDSTRVMNRLKALYRGRAIACAGTDVYKPQQRDAWLAKLQGAGARARAERLYSELDHLTGLRREARRMLVTECRRHPAAKVLLAVPTLGVVRVAQLIAAVVTPHRFRTKRQFWSYCGLAVVTRSSADHEPGGAGLRRRRKAPATRGLTASHNRTLKYVFKSAALTAPRCGPLKAWYGELLARGLRPEPARVTVARKIAAVTPAVWKAGAPFDAGRLSSGAA
ncbi:MAG: transposase [Acidobacteria bacterium]|nr:transposase [Acidobacteriota bacterium]MCA1619589.1 transposase [Acidobacteriota bacterium]